MPLQAADSDTAASGSVRQTRVPNSQARSPVLPVTPEAKPRQTSSPMGIMREAPLWDGHTCSTGCGGPKLTIAEGIVDRGGSSTSTPAGDRQPGSSLGTIVKSFGNSRNMFNAGPGTDTLVGLGAGASLDPADYLTTAVGWHALFSSTQANTESTAIGWHTQGSITVGGMNTSLGVNAIGSCLACVHDMAIGTDALRNTTTASYDIAIGVSALLDDGSAGSNIAIGDNALVSGSGATGQFNIAIGNLSLHSVTLTTARENILIGQAAGGNSVTSASGDVGIGHLAFYDLTTGSENTGIGFRVGNKITTGNANTCIGWQSCDSLTTGSNNIVIGRFPYAARESLTTGIGNILIGNGAMPHSPKGNSAINIGNTYLASASGPILSGGFGQSAHVVASAGSTAFAIDVGLEGTAASGRIRLAPQANGYICQATDVTNPDEFAEAVIPVNQYEILLKNYSRFGGRPVAWKASDVVTVSCSGY